MFIYDVTITKVNFCFYKIAVKPQHVLFANDTFLCEMLVRFFSSNIPLNIEKNPVAKLCKVLEMKLKTCTPVSLKFVFEKIKFNFFHYIQHDFIRQRSGLIKGQTSMFKRISKALLLNFSSSNIVAHSNGYRK